MQKGHAQDLPFVQPRVLDGESERRQGRDFFYERTYEEPRLLVCSIEFVDDRRWLGGGIGACWWNNGCSVGCVMDELVGVEVAVWLSREMAMGHGEVWGQKERLMWRALDIYNEGRDQGPTTGSSHDHGDQGDDGSLLFFF